MCMYQKTWRLHPGDWSTKKFFKIKLREKSHIRITKDMSNTPSVVFGVKILQLACLKNRKSNLYWILWRSFTSSEFLERKQLVWSSYFFLKQAIFCTLQRSACFKNLLVMEGRQLSRPSSFVMMVEMFLFSSFSTRRSEKKSQYTHFMSYGTRESAEECKWTESVALLVI